ncbi:hypothetical protein DICSQDRAFT_166035 [Dichomitus squalens LYAD-421 SS1]|uniref:uncharacterized protein n=1 Tax=Dichomitus squalens (strain LYAD-421) TaxID=732165 RepID=UPI0004416107|nr:uncharacterized protein DICSQDRAFT_166035 [Dichomitus squalens LYAD-421 SS1]EJF66340.1 hypothetical protein DICSQDRAFT_166035 [Dichomitus squalens LYAD-421 SS1]
MKRLATFVIVLTTYGIVPYTVAAGNYDAILSPDAGTTWFRGEKQNVIWDSFNMPANPGHSLLTLAYNNQSTPLVFGEDFDLSSGRMGVTVPWVDEGSSYQVWLTVTYIPTSAGGSVTVESTRDSMAPGPLSCPTNVAALQSSPTRAVMMGKKRSADKPTPPNYRPSEPPASTSIFETSATSSTPSSETSMPSSSAQSAEATSTSTFAATSPASASATATFSSTEGDDSPGSSLAGSSGTMEASSETIASSTMSSTSALALPSTAATPPSGTTSGAQATFTIYKSPYFEIKQRKDSGSAADAR